MEQRRKVNPRSLKNLRPFEKGQSGNPGGRPKPLLTEAYKAQLAEVKKGDAKGRTYAEAIVAAQIRKAMRGNTVAAKEIADRTEGKARQALDFVFEGDGPDIHLTVNFVDPDGKVHEEKQ